MSDLMATSDDDSRRSKLPKVAAVGGGTALVGCLAAAAAQPIVAAIGLTVALALVSYAIILAAQEVYPRIKTGNWEINFERLPKENDTEPGDGDRK
ncbi:hypothetical protein ACWEGE_20075 [Amycolatopsis sp. NPDC004747]